MSSSIVRKAGALALGVMALVAAHALADARTGNPAQSSHAHSHGAGAKSAIYNGYFEDGQVKARALSDWDGDWQSVYPYLQAGMLDEVMIQKAKSGVKSAAEYRDYYETGYRTDVHRIVIKDGILTFHRSDETFSGRYDVDGYEILTYAKGNRGVRFIFRKTSGDARAPKYIQFSDHRIAPEKSDHFHLYWGDDRAALLKEVTNWPTYYPSSLTGEQIVDEMLAH
ncbi:MAG: metal-binding protein ZinT [Hyphomicrobiales bacterium]|nr:metal-binding protein ZinT [Hyphomicrobiales bacterium]MCA1998623.1 metal-binding protein ZinT [Hyphomicrobiales bacterium]